MTLLRIDFSEPENIPCIECGKPVDQSDPLDFPGGLACESCIRAYYNQQYRELPGFNRPKKQFEGLVQQELQFRRYGGPRVLKQILRCRGKERRKQFLKAAPAWNKR